MAETIRGVHRQVVCRDCRYPFACGSDTRRIRPRAICPNCGFAENDLEGQPDIAGDRLLVHKSAFSVRPPGRWEPVAFRHPERASQACVKRLIGLPGESIQIRDTRWESAKGVFEHPSVGGTESIDWLTYHHWLRVPGQPEQTRQTHVTNTRGYNQTQPQRAENIHPVADLMLSFRLVRSFGRGRLLVRATDGRDEFLARIEPSQGRCEVHRNGRRLVASTAGKLPDRAGSTHLEMSLFDQQFLLAFDGRPALVYPFHRAGPAPRPTSRPLAIGSQGLGVEIRDLQVYRDVYYTHPIGFRGRWGLDRPVRLGRDEYFVLGDNSLVSEDSRSWPGGPAVPADLLLGKPFLVHFPARRIQLGRWHFQVPDPARIRYIR
jgi:signal peptidase I